MSGRFQPLNGADSAQGLADAIALVEAYGLSLIIPSCIACSDPALAGNVYCKGHDRLGRYTEHERSGGIAAND